MPKVTIRVERRDNAWAAYRIEDEYFLAVAHQVDDDYSLNALCGIGARPWAAIADLAVQMDDMCERWPVESEEEE